ncbi:hypothetical protein [Psychromonas aquimarina]|uniref:hypothetical protein n=1 Tax=Psychromonas aquimarina TaxID=444919 RepID=UPI00041A5D5C|nr:hypothetical protein [Psychromonas aquimarina]
MISEQEYKILAAAQKSLSEGARLRTRVLQFVLSTVLIGAGLFKLYLFNMIISSVAYETAVSFFYLPVLGAVFLFLGAVTLAAAVKNPCREAALAVLIKHVIQTNSEPLIKNDKKKA